MKRDRKSKMKTMNQLGRHARTSFFGR